jgi:polyisoprenoid-binding protein YceI
MCTSNWAIVEDGTLVRLATILISAASMVFLSGLPVRAESVLDGQKPVYKDWYIDPHDTYVRFFATEFKVKKVKGVFNSTFGPIEYDGHSTNSLKVHAELDVDQIDTAIVMRDRALKSDDFLKVSRYPLITFDSTRIVPEGPGHFRMYGNLKIRQEVKEVALEVQGPTLPFGKTASGATCFNARATTKLSRKDFGITHMSGLISDEIPVFISLRVIEGIDPDIGTRASEKEESVKASRFTQMKEEFKKRH